MAFIITNLIISLNIYAMFDAMYALYYFNIFYHTWVMKRNHFKYNIIASITF